MVMVMILKQVWRNRWLSSPLDHYVGFRAWLYHAGCIHFTAIFKLITQCHAHTPTSAISIFFFITQRHTHHTHTDQPASLCSPCDGDWETPGGALLWKPPSGKFSLSSCLWISTFENLPLTYFLRFPTSSFGSWWRLPSLEVTCRRSALTTWPELICL